MRYKELLKLIPEILKEVEDELMKSNITFKLFNSTHEGYGIIKEKFDELWNEIKKSKEVYNINDRIKEKAIHTMVMCLKLIISFSKK